MIFITIKNCLYNLHSLTCNKLIKLINHDHAVIVDIRDQQDYIKGHIINSLNISSINEKNYDFKKLNKLHDRSIVLIDNRGNPSLRMIKFFKKNGFKKIFFLKNGIMEWTKENLPLIKNK